MRYYSSTDCSRIAVGILILIQITGIVCDVERDDQSITVNDKEDLLDEDIFEHKKNLTTIRITGISLSTLPENIFKSLTNLTTLDLRRNHFQTLPENIFKSLTNLTTLDLSWNSLSTLPENVFKSLTNLTTLDLSWNSLTTLPENIFESLHNLQTLDLTYNNFTTLPEYIFKSLTNLTTLELSGNSLSTLPENVFKSLTNLTTLDLSGNSLATLPENVFKSLTNLTTLDLSGNSLSTLPENVFKSLTNLTTLDLSRNSLATLPENVFKSLTNLTTLDLRRNHFQTLPENVFKSLTNLTTLELRKNSLSKLPENIFERLHNLQELNLGSNRLKNLPQNVFKSQTNLKELDLHGNGLTALFKNIFEKQSALQILNLGENNLATLPNNIFKIQSELQRLDLSTNELTTLPDHIFENQTELKYLDLHENKLLTLSKITLNDIFKNSNLYNFDANANPWLCDCDFLERIQPHTDTFYYLSEMVCADDELITDKLNGPKIPMISKNPIVPSDYKQKYPDSIICSILSTNETRACPNACNCLFPNGETSIFVDCSNNSLESVPSDLANELLQMPTLVEIELNFDNNNITSLPNLAKISGLELTMFKISAANNSIKSISVDNFPENITEIDLSGNKLVTLTPSVIKHLSNMKMLRKLMLTGNPWICDQSFFDFIRFNKEKVDYESIVCPDGEPLIQEHALITFWIKKDSRDGDEVKSILTGSNESAYEVSHDESLGQICPSECSCFIAQQNTTITYECATFSFTNILNHFEMGKVSWPLLKHRRLIFTF